MSEIESANNGVYFLSLELENVRCFGKKQKLDLSDSKDKNRPAQWTVILGNNGTGKTTLLHSFVLATIFRRNIFRFDDYLLRANTDGLTLLSCFAYDAVLGNTENSFKYWSNKHSITTKSPVIDNGNLPPFNDNYFCLAYNANRKLLDGNIELIDAEKWLQDTYLFSEAKSQFKERFNSVKKTLVNLLPDVTEIDIYYPDENKPELKVRFLANNIWLNLNALSLGYQSMISWVVDFAARLFKHYPTSKNPIEEPAIVLIDEIDLHLHPKWQREIMRYLSERFTNTQFIVTAHSPLIVQAAEDENANIVVLRREGDEVEIKQDFKAFHGWRVDQLLASDLFDNQPTRSDDYEEWMKERREILGKAHLTDADKNRLEELKLKMVNIPTAESPEDIEAMDIIRNVAKLLKDKQ